MSHECGPVDLVNIINESPNEPIYPSPTKPHYADQEGGVPGLLVSMPSSVTLPSPNPLPKTGNYLPLLVSQGLV